MTAPARGALLAALLAVAVLTAAAGPAPVSAQAAEGTVAGTVTGRFQERSGPLPFAAVEAWAAGLRRTVVADSLGRYRVTGLPAGLIRLRVTHAGHAPAVLDVLLSGGGSALVDVELRGRPVELPALDVTSRVDVPDPDGRDAAAGGALTEVEVAALGSGAGMGEAGVAEAVRALPGNDPAQATDVLFMRGSTTDLKLVLLDGAPVYTPFHVAGLLRSFEPAAMGAADLHMGGAPARYDGGLTYILDLRTRRPRLDRLRGTGSADLLSAGATLEGPLGGSAGFVASARALHDLASEPLGSSPYGYRDALLSVQAEPAEGQVVRGTGFWNRESVRLALPRAAGEGEEAWWRNRALSASWSGRAGGLLTEATVAGGSYEASLPLQPSAKPGEPLPDPLLATAANRRLRATAEVARPGSRGVVRLGVTAERIETEYRAGRYGAHSPSVHSAAQARAVGAYVDATRLLTPEVSVRAGLRADGLSGDGGGLLLAPRASLTWALAPGAFLTVAAGRYHQHAAAPGVEVERAISAAVTTPTDPDRLLPVATADHVVLSLDQELGTRTRLGLEGFWKGYQGLSDAQGGRILSSGVDLRVRRTGEELTAWLGYGLSWFWSDSGTTGASSGEAGPDQDFSGRHLLTAGVEGQLAGPLGGEARVAYGAGLPYTSIPFRNSDGELAADPDSPTPEDRVTAQGPLAGGPEDAFLRLDLEVHAHLTPEWGGREWTLRPYLRLLNALDRRDALFYAFSRSEGPSPLAERSLIPVLGVRWRF